MTTTNTTSSSLVVALVEERWSVISPPRANASCFSNEATG